MAGIAINCRLLNERKAGPSRYLYNIIKALSQIDKKNTYYLLLRGPVDLDFSLPENFRIKILKTKSKIIFDYLRIPLFSYTKKINIFLFPKGTYSPVVKGKKIPVHHDMINFEKLGFREFKFFDHLHHFVMVPIAAKFSAVDLAVSEFTASRMKDLLKIPEQKIKVVKEAVGNNFKRNNDQTALEHVRKKFNIDLPFFFYVGAVSPRKNLINVLEAFSQIKDNIEHNIFLTGAAAWKDKKIKKAISKNGLNGRVKKLGYLTNKELIAMYSMADCLLYPSIYEGFGLPILEAQACGCPVITSNTSACPETAGEGARLVDPHNVEDVKKAMLEIADSEETRQELIENGYENCKRFSWKKSAEQLLGVFEAVASK